MPCSAEPNSADRLAGLISPGAGYSGGGDGDVAAQNIPGAACHRLCALRGNRPYPWIRENTFVGNAKDLVLDGNRIAHNTAANNGGGSLNRREATGNEPTSARLSTTERYAGGLGKPNNFAGKVEQLTVLFEDGFVSRHD